MSQMQIAILGPAETQAEIEQNIKNPHIRSHSRVLRSVAFGFRGEYSNVLSFCQAAVTHVTLAVGAIGMPRPRRETGIIAESFLVRMLGQAADAQAGSIGMIKNHQFFVHVMFRSGAVADTSQEVYCENATTRLA